MYVLVLNVGWTCCYKGQAGNLLVFDHVSQEPHPQLAPFSGLLARMPNLIRLICCFSCRLPRLAWVLRNPPPLRYKNGKKKPRVGKVCGVNQATDGCGPSRSPGPGLLFHFRQRHRPQHCPADEPGRSIVAHFIAHSTLGRRLRRVANWSRENDRNAGRRAHDNMKHLS
ncbi:hypothetical protein L209DRAFT_222044 [Thermothelomyces heterothallicus CBS 203.75]